MSLENVKVGDKVLQLIRFNQSIMTVKRVTKDFIICSYNDNPHEYKFRKKTGSQVGLGTWDYSHINILTPELEKEFKDKIRKQRLVREISSIKFDSFSLNNLEKINNLIKECLRSESSGDAVLEDSTSPKKAEPEAEKTNSESREQEHEQKGDKY